MKGRIINKWAIVAVACVVLLGILTIRVPSFIKHNKLVALGYDEAAIAGLKKQDLTKTVLKNEFYSDYFKQEVAKDSFKKEYLQLYLHTNKVNDEVIELYSKLNAKGYSEDQIISLLVTLQDYEIRPLLVFDYQEDLTPYIEDCLAHPTNTAAKFTLSGTYVSEDPEIVTLPNAYNVLVNKSHAVDTTSVTNIVDMSMSYASAGLKMEAEAYSQLKAMLDSMSSSGLGVYATSAYRTYDEQASLHNNYGAFAPGHSDMNTGLAVMLTTTSGNAFGSSSEYEWLKTNAVNYGFIQRFTDEKSYITGSEAITNLWRYVGVEAASIMKDKKMCMEEYYAYYVEGADTVTTAVAE